MSRLAGLDNCASCGEVRRGGGLGSVTGTTVLHVVRGCQSDWLAADIIGYECELQQVALVKKLPRHRCSTCPT